MVNIPQNDRLTGDIWQVNIKLSDNTYICHQEASTTGSPPLTNEDNIYIVCDRAYITRQSGQVQIYNISQPTATEIQHDSEFQLPSPITGQTVMEGEDVFTASSTVGIAMFAFGTSDLTIIQHNAWVNPYNNNNANTAIVAYRVPEGTDVSDFRDRINNGTPSAGLNVLLRFATNNGFDFYKQDIIGTGTNTFEVGTFEQSVTTVSNTPKWVAITGDNLNTGYLATNDKTSIASQDCVLTVGRGADSSNGNVTGYVASSILNDFPNGLGSVDSSLAALTNIIYIYQPPSPPNFLFISYREDVNDRNVTAIKINGIEYPVQYTGRQTNDIYNNYRVTDINDVPDELRLEDTWDINFKLVNGTFACDLQSANINKIIKFQINAQAGIIRNQPTFLTDCAELGNYLLAIDITQRLLYIYDLVNNTWLQNEIPIPTDSALKNLSLTTTNNEIQVVSTVQVTTTPIDLTPRSFIPLSEQQKRAINDLSYTKFNVILDSDLIPQRVIESTTQQTTNGELFATSKDAIAYITTDNNYFIKQGSNDPIAVQNEFIDFVWLGGTNISALTLTSTGTIHIIYATANSNNQQTVQLDLGSSFTGISQSSTSGVYYITVDSQIYQILMDTTNLQSISVTQFKTHK